MTSRVEYMGSLKTKATHLKSGDSYVTDPPVDNKGKGEAFSPTDLVATGLANCAMTIMGIAAMNHEIDIEGMYAEITKHMAADPRRISQVDVRIFMPTKAYSSKEKAILEHAALTCPVAKSLHPDLIQNFIFEW